MRSTKFALAIIASLAISAVVAGVVLAAAGDITTVAGGFIGEGVPATSASLEFPQGVAVDASGTCSSLIRTTAASAGWTPSPG